MSPTTSTRKERSGAAARTTSSCMSSSMVDITAGKSRYWCASRARRRRTPITFTACAAISLSSAATLAADASACRRRLGACAPAGWEPTLRRARGRRDFAAEIAQHLAFHFAGRISAAEQVIQLRQCTLGGHVIAADHPCARQCRSGRVLAKINCPFQTLRAIDNHHASLRRLGNRSDETRIAIGTVADAVRLEHESLQRRTQNVAHEIRRDSRKQSQRTHHNRRCEFFESKTPARFAHQGPVDLDIRADDAEGRKVGGGEGGEAVRAHFYGSAAAQKSSAEVQANFRNVIAGGDQQ